MVHLKPKMGAYLGRGFNFLKRWCNDSAVGGGESKNMVWGGGMVSHSLKKCCPAGAIADDLHDLHRA